VKETIGTWALAVGLVAGSAFAGMAQSSVTPTVYTANGGGADVSALDAGTLQPLHAAIPVDTSPQAVAVSPDHARVYSGNVATGLEGLSSVTAIDATTNTPITTVDFDTGDGVSDIAVAPDDTLVYASIAGTEQVEVLDASTFGSTELQLFPEATTAPDIEALDVATDGLALFALDVANATLVKASPADGSTLATVPVSAAAHEVKVSTDGATIIVVGDDAAQFFTTATLAPVPGAFTPDLGTQVDVAVAGPRAWVLDRAGPSIDVYTMATGAFERSIALPSGPAVNGIAVLSDASRAFVADAGGTVTAVDLTTGTAGPSGAAGASPRRVALNAVVQSPPPPPPSTEIPVVSYFLPRTVAVKLRGAGKDTLVASGFYDDGGGSPTYTDPVTVDVGGFARTFTLTKKGRGFVFKDASVRFAIVPNLKGSSRGRFRMRIARTTLAGLIDPSAAVEFHFRGTGLPDALGKVGLTGGRYRLGRVRGALIEPPFFPATVRARLGGQGLDVLSFRGGFASNGQTPAALASVRFDFGPTFTRTFTDLARTGDAFTLSQKKGTAQVAVKVDFLREVILVKAKHVELGPLTAPTVDVVLDAGAGTIRNTIRLATKGAVRRY